MCRKITIILFLFLLSTNYIFSQCGPGTPSFIVDLSDNAQAVWTSASVIRNDNCCGTNFPDRCIKFIITLHPDAVGINFEVIEGAVPSGALFYQIGCGPQIPVGEPICLSGPGPHLLTFCKPGKNENIYRLSSIPPAVGGTNVTINDGCVGQISATGFNASSVVWKSIYPGAPGDYDNYLSCLTGCLAPTARAVGTPPSYVDYQVCGVPAALCSFPTICDTVRVTFHPTLFVSIVPQEPTICFGSTSTTITAVGSGGTPPYSYLWNNINPSQTVSVGLGTYTVKLSDASDCPPTYNSVTVTSFSVAISANAGSDQTVCAQNNPILRLDGSVTGASGGVWSGGVGTYNPNNTTLSNVFYTPTAAELAAGSVSLVLTTTGNGTCPSDNDTVVLNFTTFDAVISTTSTNVSCYGGNDGSATVSLTGGASPFTYAWNTSPIYTTATINNLIIGTYSVTVTDAIGCTKQTSAIITQPSPLALNSSITNVSCSGSNNGAVAITPVGGTPPYSYSWLPGGQATSTLSAQPAGTYTVTVTDSKNCQITSSYTITQPSPLLITFTSTNVDCFNGNNGSINSTVSGGTSPYTYSWSSGASSPNLTGITAGTYILTITDSKGCVVTNSVVITQPTAVLASTTSSNETCNYLNNGTATAVASGGTAGYTYLWRPGLQTSATISGLSAGTYSITITDSKGCSAITTAVISQPTALVTGFAGQINVSCFGGNDGAVSATVSGGTPNYSYLWSPGSATTNAISNLTAGTYSITATDSRGCTATNSVVITQPTVVTASTSSTNETCNYLNNGTATAIASGGTAGYTYLWRPGLQTTGTVSGLSSGTYSLTITDSKGCSANATAVIAEPTVLTTTFSSQVNVSCFGGSDGSATVSASGGTAGYTYLWASGGTTTVTKTNLSAGTYSVTATDSKGCIVTNSVVITQPTVVLASTTSSNETCNYLNNGTATAVASGGTAGYTYLWRPGLQTSATISGLSAGTYSLTITDSKGCSAITTAVITQPTILVTGFAGQVNVSCFGGNDGAVSATVSGGTPNYSYLWSPGSATTNAISNLTAGTYSITATDSRGCTATNSVVITQPTVVTASTSSTNETCNYLNNGTATAIASGGTAGYTYVWRPGLQTTGTVSGLSSGTYSLTITDSKGCSANATAVITEPTVLTTTFSSQVNVSCFGGSDGSATVSASGGTAGYTYLWASGGTTTVTKTNLSAGTYSVTATDSKGCIVTNSVVITQPTAVLASTTSSNETCNYLNNGTATAVASGGTAGYTYLWRPGLQTSATISGLSAGTYSLTITDSKGCSAITTAVISQPTALVTGFAGQINVSCFGGNDGAVSATVSGGTPNYSYLWSPGSATTNAISNLTAGTYSVTMTDSRGCTSTNSVIISEPLVPLAVSSSATPVSCYGGADGSASASASGGTGTYTYTWMPGSLTGQTVSNLTAGTYIVTAHDMNGCTSTSSVTITQPAEMVLTTSSVNSDCGQPNGQTNVSVSGGNSPYTYQWSPSGGTNATATGLISGAYNVVVTDFTGCTATQFGNVNENSAPEVTIIFVKNVTCYGGNDGSATLGLNGGVGPFTYSWSPYGGTDSIANGLVAGAYTVFVVAANGCKSLATTSPPVSEPPPIVQTVSTNPVSCFAGNNGIASVSASGGTPGYTYEWLPGGSTGDNVSDLSATTYSVEVTDAVGCKQTDAFSVAQPTQLFVSISSSPVSCSGGSDASVSAAATGGTPPYNYGWMPGNLNGQDLSNLPEGTYTVTVTDSKGCVTTNTVSITEPTAITLVTDSVNSNCSLANGQASVVASGGTGSYMYLWTPSGNSNDIATGLYAQTYAVSVTDANGCISTDSITVNDNPAPVATVTLTTNVGCNGGDDGTATVTVSGGASPYTYSWSVSGATSATATGLIAGTYTVIVTDANGCESLPAESPFITEPPMISTIISSTPVSCFNGSDGTASAISSGGTPGYTYLWLPGGSTENAISGLTEGTYTLTTTDMNNCEIQTTTVIEEPALLSVSVSSLPVSCFGGSDGSVSATGEGGTVPYNYAWLPGNINGQDLSGLSAATYTVTITDSKGCITTNTVSISEPTPIMLVTDSVDSKCSLANGQASVVASGGTGSYTYLWTPSGNSSDIATGLYAQTHTISVTDANGCVSVSSVTVNDNPSPVATVTLTTNVSCNGGADGTATVTVLGGTSPFAYSWSGSGGTNQTATGLTAGMYTVIVIDANSCESNPAKSPDIMEASEISTIVTPNHVSCFGGSDGEASAISSGGTPGYSYLWLPGGAIGSSINNHSAGTYTVQVTDLNNCITSLPITLTEPTELTAKISAIKAVNCFQGNDGEAEVEVSGGIPFYNVNWMPLGLSGLTTTGLSADTYTVTAIDMNGCTTITTVPVTEPTQALTATGTSLTTSCFGASDGTAMVSATGGTPDYSYQWNPMGGTEQNASGLTPQNYFILVTDNNGCQTNVSMVVTEPTALSGNLVSINPSCGLSNGSISSEVSGGTPPYTYLWSAGSATSSGMNGVGPGTYTLKITDANNCDLLLTETLVNISGANVVVASVDSVSCFAGNDGSASIAVSQGTAPYSINWLPYGGSNLTATMLIEGSYTVNVTDALGCVSTINVVIAEPTDLEVSIASLTNVLCNGESTGSISIAASGGTPDYSYAWLPSGSNLSTANDLSAGSYTINISDQNNCSKSISAYLYQPAILLSSITNPVNPACYGLKGSATVNVTGGTIPYSYLWSSDSALSASTENIPVGTHTVTVTDANKCQTTNTVTLTEPTKLITIGGPNDTVCIGQTAKLSATATGGAGNYYYAWQPTSVINAGTINLVPDGDTTYIVVAYDKNGCPGTADTVSATAYSLAPANIDAIGMSPICPGQTSTIYVQTSGAKGPLTYVWNNNLGNGPGAYLVTPTQPTTYVVTVSNVCGSSVSDSIPILFNPPPTLALTADTNSLCTPGAVQFFDSSVTGNVNDPITSWYWSFQDGTFSTEQNPSHIYTQEGTYYVYLTVTTAGGCTATNSIAPELIIEAHKSPMAAFSINSPMLTVPMEKLITNNLSEGASFYEWNFGEGGTSTEFNPQYVYTTVGIYQIQLIATSQYSCSDTAYSKVTTTANFIFPNAFTPNSNGPSGGVYDRWSTTNDVFFPYTMGVIEYKLEIFNRWGEQIFESLDVNIGWDGYYRGQLCQQDVYVWKAYLKLNNGKEYTQAGDVTLMR